ncbi:hypothetical protein [Streptomyces avermitilis]|uniref:hypothetical protein n=1 Tax=Streptomyces avermitilis TaxID=33903 RepID=UPI0036819045
MAESAASAGCWIAVASSVISGRVFGPSTNGRVTWVAHGPTAHSKGPAAQIAVCRSRQIATSSTGMSYFARRWAT